MEPEVVYNDEAFGRFLETNWKEEGLCTVEEQSGESPSPARRRGSDPSPDRIPGYYQKMIENDDDRDLRFDVYDWNRSGTHEIIGSFHTSVKKLRTGPNSENTYDVINKEKQKKKGKKYNHSGSITLDSIKVEIVPSNCNTNSWGNYSRL